MAIARCLRKVLLCALTVLVLSAAACAFSDVTESFWARPYIDAAAESGLLKGYEDGSFRPTDAITREQLVSVLWRYAGRPILDIPEGEDVLSAFTDADRISPYARSAMAWAVSVGLVAGKGNGMLDPRGKASGRGAYLCRDAACLKKALKSRALERALSVAIPQEVYERLLSEMEAAEG